MSQETLRVVLVSPCRAAPRLLRLALVAGWLLLPGLGVASDPSSPARPSSSTSSIETAETGKEKCIQGCKATHRDAVKLCDTLYPPKHRIEDHRKCLDKARTTFDACTATCR